MKNKQQNAPEKSEVFCVVGNLKKERFVLRGGTLRFIFSERFVLRIIYDYVDYTSAPGSEFNWSVSGTLTLERQLNTQIPDEDQAIEW